MVIRTLKSIIANDFDRYTKAVDCNLIKPYLYKALDQHSGLDQELLVPCDISIIGGPQKRWLTNNLEYFAFRLWLKANPRLSAVK